VTESFRADGVRVLITGGTSGLGAAMAAALLDAGAAVAITGRDTARAESTAGELGPTCVGVGMDVRDEADVARGVDWVVTELGGLDVLVNNAGIGMRTVNPQFLTDPQPFWAVSPEGFRDLVATNLTGNFLVARAVVPLFLAAGAGRVVATATGMVPDDYPPEQRARLLDPEVMGPPIRWLCSPQAAGVHGERIVATEFDEWLSARKQPGG
jgi:NAD(P)-dependent dehydrogenase (short-subunit alcohol dehydrogenase family)